MSASDASNAWDLRCDVRDKHVNFLSEIREKMWDRICSEQEMMPNPQALEFHWQRSVWVFNFWSKASVNFMKLRPLVDSGWRIAPNDTENIECIWDSDLNFRKIEQTVEWYTKGCACKRGCTTNRCKCRKSKSNTNDGTCGPGCKCTNCLNLPVNTTNLEDVDLSISDEMLEDLESEQSDEEDVEVEENISFDLISGQELEMIDLDADLLGDLL